MMIELSPFLKQLITAAGLSANEAPIRALIADAWRPLVDELSTSPVGSLHGLRRGSGPDPRPRLLLSAHMDAIGLMITGSTGGFLRITGIGGVDPRILPGQPVTVHGRQDLPGVVVQPSDRLLPAAAQGKPVAMEYLLIDTGLPAEEVAKLVRVGDLASFAQVPLELSGAKVSRRIASLPDGSMNSVMGKILSSRPLRKSHATLARSNFSPPISI